MTIVFFETPVGLPFQKLEEGSEELGNLLSKAVCYKMFDITKHLVQTVYPLHKMLLKRNKNTE